MGLGWLALVAGGTYFLCAVATLPGQVPLYPGQPSAIRLLSTAAGQPLARNLHPAMCGAAGSFLILLAAASLRSSQLRQPEPMWATYYLQLVHMFAAVVGGIFWPLQAGFTYKIGNGKLHTQLAVVATSAGMGIMFWGGLLAWMMDLDWWIVWFRLGGFALSCCMALGLAIGTGDLFQRMFQRDKFNASESQRLAALTSKRYEDDAHTEDGQPLVSLQDDADHRCINERDLDPAQLTILRLKTELADLRGAQYDPSSDVAHEDSHEIRMSAIVEYLAQLLLSLVFCTYYNELDELSIS